MNESSFNEDLKDNQNGRVFKICIKNYILKLLYNAISDISDANDLSIFFKKELVRIISHMCPNRS